MPLALPPHRLLERKLITGFRPVMEIAITITAVPSQEDLLLDTAAALQRELNGALEFRWLAQGEAMDLILPAGEKTSSPQAESGTPSQPSQPGPSPWRERAGVRGTFPAQGNGCGGGCRPSSRLVRATGGRPQEAHAHRRHGFHHHRPGKPGRDGRASWHQAARSRRSPGARCAANSISRRAYASASACSKA